jgi:glutamate synthase (ferredoxin)
MIGKLKFDDMIFPSLQEKTGSAKAQEILNNWEKFLPLFWQIVPPSEEDTPEANPSYTDQSLQEMATL